MTKIALVSGTGKEGLPLALRWAMSGHQITIGSRNLEKAQGVAHRLMSDLKNRNIQNDIQYGNNMMAVKTSDVVVLTFPYAALLQTLVSLKDSIRPHTIIICPIINLINKDGNLVNGKVDGGSVAELVSKTLPQTRVVSAFQTVSAKRLADFNIPVVGDVPVCSDHIEATEIAMQLVSDIPNLCPIDSGKLCNSCFIEDLAAFIINIGRKSKRTDLGVKIL